MAFSDLGFKSIFSPRFNTVFPVEDLSTVNVFSLSDPRGLLPSGMVPSSTIQYKIVNGAKAQGQTSSILSSFVGNPLGGGVISSFASFSLIGDVVFAKINTQTAIVVFEGRDVIDLPTDDLETDGDAIIVPDLVFRPLYAGDEKFIGPEDNISIKSALSYGRYLEDNRIIGIKPRADSPPDTRFSINSLGQNAVDTSSNRIRVDGLPGFISYVAIDRLLFRDVITISASIEIFGSVNPEFGFSATGSSIASSRATLLRYTFLPQTEEEENGLIRSQWKLTESIGRSVTPKDGIQKTPDNLRENFTTNQRIKDGISSLNFHAVYDIREEAEEDLTNKFSAKPLKGGYSPAFAKAKLDPQSDYFDENFKAVIQDFKLGLGASGTFVDPESSIVSNNVGLTADALSTLSYISQNYEVKLNNSGRIGVEYSLQVTGNVESNPDFTLILAKTTEAATGVSVVYDCGLSRSYVFDISSDLNTITERVFDDFSWNSDKIKRPESNLKKYLLGEIPFKSDGGTVFLPKVFSIDIDGDLSLSTEDFVVAFVSTVEDGLKVSLFDTSNKDPIFETEIPSSLSANGSGKEITITTPPLKFISSEGNIISKVLVSKIGSKILESFEEFKDTSTISSLQLSKVDSLKFPVVANNLHACSDDSSNITVIAFENGERIDLAVRFMDHGQVSILRDVVLRIPDDLEEISDPENVESFPPASLPYVICDQGTQQILLFYTYKNKLLVKKIPIEIFRSKPVASVLKRYSLESELSIVKSIHALSSRIVYDGDGSFESIEIDIKKGSIKVFEDERTDSLENSDKVPKKVSQYSACMDGSGYIYVFIQTEDKMSIRKSPNIGDSWTDAVLEEFSLIPDNNVEEKPKKFPESPYCHIDPATNTMFIFFFFEDSLLFQKIPTESLQIPKASSTVALGNIKPVVLVGPLTQDMIDRGITRQPTVNGIRNTTLIQPHRVAATTTAQGYSRIFYKDDKKILRSLITFNSGEMWVNEDQYDGTI